MSRLSESVSLELIRKAGIAIPEANEADEQVSVSYGYDYPLHNYFMQIWFDEDDDPVGFDYGGIGLGKRIGRWEMYEMAKEMGLVKLVTAIGLDLPV